MQIPAGAHKQACRSPPSRRHGATGAEKDNVEVHEGESNGGVRRLCTARRSLSGRGSRHAVEDPLDVSCSHERP